MLCTMASSYQREISLTKMALPEFTNEIYGDFVLQLSPETVDVDWSSVGGNITGPYGNEHNVRGTLDGR